MCIKCVYIRLEQLHWELILQETELSGTTPSPEIIDTVKERTKENGVLLPRIRLEKPAGMDDQHYAEATEIFKQALLHRRRQEIAAIQLVSDLLEREIVFQNNSVVTVNANTVLNGGEDDDSDGLS